MGQDMGHLRDEASAPGNPDHHNRKDQKNACQLFQYAQTEDRRGDIKPVGINIRLMPACPVGRSHVSRIADQSGMALVLVLMIVALITAMVVEFAYGVYVNTNALNNWQTSQKL